MTTLVIIPTFREVDNLEILIPQLVDISPSLKILIIDDDSKDGTQALVRRFQNIYGARVYLIARQANPSYAESLMDGIRFAISEGYESVIQMDADGSHVPAEILNLIQTPGDVVIGSRYVTGSSVNYVPWHRRIYSILGNIYISLLWRTLLRDKTNGFRLFRKSALDLLVNFESETKGFAIQIEVLYYLYKHPSITINETPTRFNFRHIGDSKFEGKKLWEALILTNKLNKK
jgi:dolichol-phosphate mannosyltransferase